MKKIIFALLLLLFSCTPTVEPYPPPSQPPVALLALSSPRVTISTNGIDYQCSMPLQGITVNASNVTVHDCTITGDTSNAGGIAVNGNNNKVLNSVITGACMAGIIVNGNYNVIEGNDISKSKQCTGTSGPDADGIRYFKTGNIIRGNFIHDIVYSSVNTTAHIDCFQTWGGATDTIIENNVCDNPTTNTTLAGSGGNIENDVNSIWRNNYFHISGKQIMVETSSSGTIIQNNIFISGPVITAPPYQYGIFGSGSNETATGNIFFGKKSENGTSFLLGVSNISGNLLNTDPKMNGYCSIAYPDRGVPCGVVPLPINTPVTVTGQPQISTNTPNPSVTPSATKAPTATRTVTPTATSTPAGECFELVDGGKVCVYP